MVNSLTCPQCAAKGVIFDPALHQLHCQYCGWTEAVPESETQVEEQSYQQYLEISADQLAPITSEALSVKCPACGAITDFKPPQVAGDCPFCGTHITTQPASASPAIKPNGILPFSIEKRVVMADIRTWLGRRWFAPNDLKKVAQTEGIQGVYLPFWTYDAFTASHYRGERGEYYYKTEVYYKTNKEGKRERNTRKVRHTRWYRASGHVERFFDDVLIPASRSISMNRLKQLEPWHYQGSLKPYDDAYVSGYKVERYQINLNEGFELAKADMDSVIRGDVRSDIGGDDQRIDHISTTYQAVTFKHLLLPVWLFSYRYHGKSFQVVVNARTKEILGDCPLSRFKVGLAIISGVALLALIIYLVVRYGDFG